MIHPIDVGQRSKNFYYSKIRNPSRQVDHPSACGIGLRKKTRQSSIQMPSDRLSTRRSSSQDNPSYDRPLWAKHPSPWGSGLRKKTSQLTTLHLYFHGELQHNISPLVGLRVQRLGKEKVNEIVHQDTIGD